MSDHSPATAELKHRGGGDLQQAWGGVSGLQVGFTAVAHEARRRGIGIEAVSRWMARGTADLVGLRHKGRIAVGADADLVVHDPTVPTVVDAARLAHRNPLTAYDGQAYDGRVLRTVVRGRVIAPRRARPLLGPDAGAGGGVTGQVHPPPRLLMGPGPITADPRVLRAMSAPLVGQFDPFMTATMNEVMALYRGVFDTANEQTFLVDGTSRAGIEAALVSLLEPGDRVLVPVFGRFGHLLAEIGYRCGAEVHTIEVPWGRGVRPGAGRGGGPLGAAEGARGGARRHLDHDVPTARRHRGRLP
ncbi:amidohydrolase family protein [Nocardioides sp. TF02-7]|uniref:amidohydrolase family protein n=1 Tax=Nocardioides sp. TF02-7 TaxID=2917724 RepID=UPI001F053494|nr:amidohydrolase family protein [Nocardioides sp. TF02-7]UMG91464.1 amidohydrolase family protein [Nocardioides sp. TF02-7]